MMHALHRTFSLPRTGLEWVAPSAASATPLTAADYLRLRREARGLTVGDVALQIAPGSRHLSAALDLITLLELPGNVARRAETLDRLQSVFPFDPAVYRQLADEPADRHPRVCRGCGCSAWDSDDDHPVPFAWSRANACIRCASPREERQ